MVQRLHATCPDPYHAAKAKALYGTGVYRYVGALLTFLPVLGAVVCCRRRLVWTAWSWWATARQTWRRDSRGRLSCSSGEWCCTGRGTAGGNNEAGVSNESDC